MWAEDELALTYRKGQDLIIPYGTKLGFTGTGGEKAELKFDAGAFQIIINDVTVVSFASGASFSALQTEVINARSGEPNLLARITTVNTTATTANGVAATAQSEVTAARQGEPSLTAKVTQLSTATATVDGKLNASYALTVDVNGRIASMKLLSNGTTSSVKFLASTFQVFDGTSDVPTFEVSGGNVYVAGNKVRSESIVANAITQGVIDEDDTEATVTTSWTALADVSITVPDAATLVKVDWSIYVSTTGDPEDDLEIRIKRGSTVVYETVATRCPPMVSFFVEPDQQFDIPIQVYGQFSGFDSDSPGAGSYTYYLEGRGAGGNWGISKRRLFAMKFVR